MEESLVELNRLTQYQWNECALLSNTGTELDLTAIIQGVLTQV